MTFDESLADRVRAAVAGEPALTEKRMFGGLAFLLSGHMAVGLHGDELIVRVDPGATAALLAKPGVRPFDITGRPMKGWLLVSAAAVGDARRLRAWVDKGLAYARSLPAK